MFTPLPEWVDSLVEHLEAGRPPKEWCDADTHRPPIHIVSRWMRAKDSVGARLTEARATGCEVLVEEARDLADHALHVPAKDRAATAQAAKLAIETRLRLAHFWDRDNYGERQRVDMGGTETPLQLDVSAAALRVQNLLELAKARRIAAGAGPVKQLTSSDEDWLSTS